MSLTVLVVIAFGQTSVSDRVPGAKPLRAGGDRSVTMVEGIDRFLTRKTAEIGVDRRMRWESMVEPGFKGAEPLRARLRISLGMDPPTAHRPTVTLIATTETPSLVADTQQFTADAVRWNCRGGFHAEGLLLRPKRRGTADAVAIPDAGQTPEMICGLAPGLPPESQFARQLAEAGATVLVPTLIDCNTAQSGNREIGKQTRQPHREWIYRQSYELGRHLLGYETEEVIAAVDYFKSKNGGARKILVAGHGEGGLLALYAGALDRRIDGVYAGGAFQDREALWSQPIWRNVWGLLKDFNDPELAALILPRTLFVDRVPLDGPNGGAWQAVAGGTPGAIVTPSNESYDGAVQQARRYADKLGERAPAAFRAFSAGSRRGATDKSTTHLCPGLAEFCATFGLPGFGATQSNPTVNAGGAVDLEDRQRRLVSRLVEHTQRLYRSSERERRESWRAVDPNKIGVTGWHAACAPLREKFRREVLGAFDDPKLPPNPRSRKLRETPKFMQHEVVLDVWPEVFAWGYLLLPKGLKEGEQRPVVVCQHGLEGVPEDVLAEDPRHPGFGPYQAFAARLAERGFVVFAPHNPYRGKDKFRVLQRKANPLGRSLFSVIVVQHEVITDWLASLPFVDPSRIGFYGLSYGGKTAMRVPALVDRYCLSICSADFNDWIRKNVVVDDPHSYMFTGEYEMPEFNLGRTFNYGEMAALIAPRPFMVERGHHDGVAPDEWVGYEYAKVRRLYAELGIAARTEIEFFLGPHQIHGVGTFEFLHRHLRWPKR